MSETYLSLNDFYEFKHVRTLKTGYQIYLKKKLTLFYLNKAMLAKEYVKTNLSCDCTEFGICNQFIRRIKTISIQRDKMVEKEEGFKRFKAAINAILFILSYKVETIKKFRKGCIFLKLCEIQQQLKILDNCVQSLIAQTYNQYSSIQIIIEVIIEIKIRIKTTPDDETFSSYSKQCQRTQKSQVSLYMDKMLKDVIPKFVAHLKPLSYLNQKLIKQNSAKSITQASFSQFNNLQVQSNLQRFPTVHVESIANNQYKMNNKDLLKLIDSLKVRHRIIRCKK